MVGGHGLQRLDAVDRGERPRRAVGSARVRADRDPAAGRATSARVVAGEELDLGDVGVGSRGGQAERVGRVGVQVGAVGGRVEGGRGRGVVDGARGDHQGDPLVAGAVGRDHAEVVAAVGDGGRVEADRVGRARVAGDRRPAVRAGGRALEGDRGETGAAVRSRGAQRDGAAQVRARVVERGGRSRVVDPHAGDRGRGRRVAGGVGDDHAQVVEPVGDRGRVPGGGDCRPGSGACGRGLVGDRVRRPSRRRGPASRGRRCRAEA